jgi:uncharacterized membrane protein
MIAVESSLLWKSQLVQVESARPLDPFRRANGPQPGRAPAAVADGRDPAVDRTRSQCVLVLLKTSREPGSSLSTTPSARHRRTRDGGERRRRRVDGEPYHQAADGQFVPADDYEEVETLYGPAQMPPTAKEIYRAYVEHKWLPPHIKIPVFLCAFLLGLYLLGKFLAAGVGRFFWLQFERLIIRVPLVRNVYSSVKQVTDFVFSEREIEYTRVVAVEYPRRGIWQLAFVTGESLLDISAAANEPLLTVFFPCSPMPVTGFTAVVKRSETLDLNITMEQALQFMVSCGVVVPPHDMSQTLEVREPSVRPALPSATPQG